MTGVSGLIVWLAVLGTSADPSDRFANDPHRPLYHFLPPANWMNDPNGLIYWKGQYHVFYQHNPNGAFWGSMHWGHAVSPDLVHWTHLPIALAPTPGGPDKDGCFSGCAVAADGKPAILYTGVDPQVQCLATSDDDLKTLKKHPGNPVIKGPPPGLDVVGFRDPCVWKEGDTWLMAIGSGLKGVGGTVLLYSSKDLTNWTYLHPLCTGDKGQTGLMWECPSFFPLGKAHVLLVSAEQLRKVVSFVGRYDAERRTFSPERQSILDVGGYYYAPQTFLDAEGRRVIFGWLKEGRSDKAQRASGWAGVLSLPWILSMRPDGEMGVEPHPAVRDLRGKHQQRKAIAVAPGSANLLPDLEGDAMEIVATFEPGSARRVGMKLRRSPDGKEQTLVAWDREREQLIIDREHASLNPETERGVQGGLLKLSGNEPLTLHIFIDRSVIEVIANGRACASTRVYPSRAESQGLDLFAEGGTARLTSLDVWTMTPMAKGNGRAD